MAARQNLGELIKAAPGVFDPDAAEQMREAMGSRFADLPLQAQSLLNGAAGCAPYLRRLILADPDLVFECLAAAPEEGLKAAQIQAQDAAAEETEAAQMRGLRLAKRRAALTIALADLGGVWDVMQAAEALSRFADAAVDAAISAAVREAGLNNNAGVVVLAMGKHGALELNYSSDIDLIVLFDRERMGLPERGAAQAAAVKVARHMVALLQTQTADGYVFRTDLRLRPDPGASALAVSVEAAEAYYESYGQNWERMAFIKARACAGDVGLGEHVLKSLRPFVWRKYLDFAAIEDIHAVKRQIHAVKGGAEIEFEGHDVKLGRGGIREIEFYVQTQQLILGGKDDTLRARASLDALDALHDAGHVTKDACDSLGVAYRYLRHVEHRLQMLNDEQTHRMPREHDDLERIRAFAGEADLEAFRTRLGGRLHDVESCYADLFENLEMEAEPPGTLVFTGVDDHPGTLETLARMGFSRGGEVSEAIRTWHRGGLRATRTERARVLLTKLIPPLLEALSNAADPDGAFFAFEAFIAALPSGVQVFSLLLNNLGVFDALIRIITVSPYLARQLSKQHNFIEQLLDSQWRAAPTDISVYHTLCREAAAQANDYEGILNAVRRVSGEQRFQIAAQLAVGLIKPQVAARHFTAVADACICVLAPAAQDEMSRQHGEIDGELAVIGLGALGAGEMSATSDIDVMFVYDAPTDATSAGPRSLAASDYYTRLVRRIVTALSAATEEGALYEVDMQLRPSGRAGPAAVRFAAFQRYYSEEAWTWEIMSLVRARTVSAPPKLDDSVMSEIDTILRRNRDRKTVAQDVTDMRERLLEVKPGNGPWDVKNVTGGLTDIAFVSQFLALTSAHRIGPPSRSTHEALTMFAEKGELPHEKAIILLKAQGVFETALQLGRAASGGVFSPVTAGRALRDRMVTACGVETLEQAEIMLMELQLEVVKVFRETLSSSTAFDASRGE